MNLARFETSQKLSVTIDEAWSFLLDPRKVVRARNSGQSGERFAQRLIQPALQFPFLEQNHRLRMLAGTTSQGTAQHPERRQIDCLVHPAGFAFGRSRSANRVRRPRTGRPGFVRGKHDSGN